MTEGDLVLISGAYPSRLVVQDLRIIGSAVGSQKEAIEVLKFAARGIVKAHIEVREMGDLTRTLEDMHAGKLHGRVVLALL
jgi:propanol-preferring alcohol dehydrogenase